MDVQSLNMSKKTTTTTTTTTVVTTVETTPSKKSTTYYKFILDRSGSMASIQKPTVDSFNEQIGTLKRLQEEFPQQKYIVSLIIFDDVIETVIDNKPVSEVPLLSVDTYIPRGTTALYDAIGKTIQETKTNIGKLLTEQVEETECLVVVLTDGQENASKEFTSDTVRTLISEVDAKKNWSLMFIGSDQNAVLAARNIGFSAGNTAKGNFNAQGIKSMNVAMSNVLHRSAYAKDKGVSLDGSMYLAAVSDASGDITETLDLSDIDALADKAKDDAEDAK